MPWDENRRIGHLWRINADGSGAIQLTYGEGEHAPRWSPDGNAIAFLASRGEDEDAQLYLLPNDGGEAQALTAHPTAVSDVTWAPSGEVRYFLAPDEKPSDQQQREEGKDDVYAFDENYEPHHLWRVAVSSGDAERITSGDDSILAYELSRDGARLAYHRASTPLFGDAERGEVWVSDADVWRAAPAHIEHGTRVRRDTLAGQHAAPALCRARTSASSSTTTTTSSSCRRLAAMRVLSPTGFRTRSLPRRGPRTARPSMSWPTRGFAANSFAWTSPTGPPRSSTGDHAVRAWRYSAAADQHVIQLDTPSRAGDLWILETRTAATPRRVTDVFGYPRARLPAPEAGAHRVDRR